MSALQLLHILAALAFVAGVGLIAWAEFGRASRMYDRATEGIVLVVMSSVWVFGNLMVQG